jgi:hypothetical protein
MLKIIAFIISLFRKAGKALAYVDEAITVVNDIKQALSSDFAVKVTDLIPGNWDNVARVKVVYALNKASVLLWKIDECQDATTAEQKVACYLKWLKLQNDEVKALNYAKIALLIAQQLGDSLKISEAELNAIIQTRYVQRKQQSI